MVLGVDGWADFQAARQTMLLPLLWLSSTLATAYPDKRHVELLPLRHGPELFLELRLQSNASPSRRHRSAHRGTQTPKTTAIKLAVPKKPDTSQPHFAGGRQSPAPQRGGQGLGRGALQQRPEAVPPRRHHPLHVALHRLQHPLRCGGLGAALRRLAGPGLGCLWARWMDGSGRTISRMVSFLWRKNMTGIDGRGSQKASKSCGESNGFAAWQSLTVLCLSVYQSVCACSSVCTCMCVSCVCEERWGPEAANIRDRTSKYMISTLSGCVCFEFECARHDKFAFHKRTSLTCSMLS